MNGVRVERNVRHRNELGVLGLQDALTAKDI